MRWFAVVVVGWLTVMSAPVQAQGTVRVDAAQIRQALRRYQREPPVAALVRVALSSRTSTPGRVRDAMDRARATGWLPTTRAAVRRGQAVDLRGLTSDSARTNVSTDDDLMLEARLVFRFDRIVFASEEVGLLRELRATEAEQRELSRVIVQIYFERRRMQLERDLTGAADLARQVRILELEALLDAFTGGAFTRMMRRPRGDE